MQVTLTKIYRSDKDKNGNPLIGKAKTDANGNLIAGRPYTKIGIKTREHGEAWLSGFGGHWNQDWKEGDTVEVDIERSGDFLNFRKPDPVRSLEQRIAAIEKWIEEHAEPVDYTK
jgi:hypothetical protein